MEAVNFPLLSALWLGILTSVSPCPLASNVAAVSFILKRVEHPASVLYSGVLYTTGRVLCYTALGILIASSVLSIPRISYFLQNHMNQFLGPILIITGLILLEIFRFTFFRLSPSEKIADRFKNQGVAGALPLGILFALSFCPISAALFFGSLLPLCLKYNSSVIFPSMYGVGTGLPVMIFAFVLSFGIKGLEKVFKRITHVEYWMRRVTGILFILVGIYYVLTHIFYLELL